MRVADLQVIVPKMTEIASMHGSDSARQLLAAQKSADRTKEMVDADTREVRAKKESQAVVMRADKGRGDSGRGGRRNRRGGGHGGDSRDAGDNRLDGDTPDAVKTRIDIRL
jgi:hypothetical protein